MPLPPGPRGPSAFSSVAFARRPLDALQRWQRRYGDAFTIRFVGIGSGVYIADPAVGRDLFTGDQSDLRAGEANSFLEPILGKHSVLVLDGPEHLRHRRLLLPPFQGSRVAAFREVVCEVAEREVDGWRAGDELVLRDRMRALTFEVICRAVFGVTEPERVERLREALAKVIDTGIVAFIPLLRTNLGRWSPGGRLKRRLEVADALLYEEIELRRGEPDLEQRTDVLSLLMRARDEDGRPLRDEELRDELITMLGAGHETTATALTFALEYLMRDERVMSRLRASIAAGEDDYLQAIMRETLRLRPVIDAPQRTLTKPRRVAGWDLAAGTRVFPASALIHLRPDLYPEPQEFRPERFLDAEPESYSWLPFGGGIRRCIGAALAQTEIVDALRVIAGRAELRPLRAEPDPVVLRGITLAPKHGTRVEVESVRGRSDERLEALEQVLDDARGGAPDEVAVDGVGGRPERHALPD